MKNNNYNFDSKENLGHGIKGESNTPANDLKSVKNNADNKPTNGKNKRNDIN